MPDPFPDSSPVADDDPFATFVRADGQRESDRRAICYDSMVRGDQIGNFRIQRLLGKGSFGAVYLARELSLDRLVAVKVVLPEGQRATAGEGRSLARLRHRNIVGVYGEAKDSVSGCSLLWMQFVDGCNLAKIIREFVAEDIGSSWTEADLLRQLNPDRPLSDLIKGARYNPGTIEMVCRIGHQLAQALDHAHRSGVTHRDIKPANILLQRDGTPLLADFNLADNQADLEHEASTGGTVAYMPPEQLEQVLGKLNSYDAARGDVYSLGMVLWELLYGSRPYAEEENGLSSSGVQRLLDILAIRKRPVRLDQSGPEIGLAMVLQRAMAPDPANRFPSARAMATALAGSEELERARRRVATMDAARQFVRRHLIWFILVLGLLPHFAASGFQSAYNFIFIKPDPNAFQRAFISYNLVVYPACIGWLAWNLIRFASTFRRVVAREPLPRAHVWRLRRGMLRLPRQFMITSAVGWFPGIILFPWLLTQFGSPPTTTDWFHWGVSFAIAGLIATTYSYALVLYVVICHGYRACWQTATHYRAHARNELAGMDQRIRIISILAGVLPLAAAVLLLAIAVPTHLGMGSIDHVMNQSNLDAIPIEVVERLSEETKKHLDQMRQLHALLIGLIVFGAIGLYLVQMASARLIGCVRSLTLADE